MTFPLSSKPTSFRLAVAGALATALALASGVAVAATGSDKPAAKPAATTVAAANTAAAAKPAVPAVRDWSTIDTNRDNLISPEEMEAFLAKAR